MKTDEKADLDGSGEAGYRTGRPEGATTLADRRDRHQITRERFYQWRDRLLGEGAKLFACGGVDKAAERLKAENQRTTGAPPGEVVRGGQALLPKLEALTRDHPAWRSRRVWA